MRWRIVGALGELLWRSRIIRPRYWAIALLVATCAAFTYMWLSLRSMDYETSVDLPEASEGRVVDLNDPVVIHLTAQGEVAFQDETVTLNELAARLPRAGTHRPVIVCADRRAPFMQLAWVRAVLLEGGFDRLYTAVRRGHARRVLVTPPGRSGKTVHVRLAPRMAPYELPDIDPELLEGIEIPERRVGADHVVTVGGASTRVTRAKEVAALVPDGHRVVVTGDGRDPVEEFVAIMNALAKRDVTRVMLGIWQPHAWIRAQRRLPTPVSDAPVYEWPPDWRRDMPDLTLPVASRGSEPGDTYHLVISLTAGGTYLDADRVDLAHVQALKKKPAAVPVLVRADKDLPWRVVHPLLDGDWLDLRLGVMRVADRRYDAHEARSLGCEWSPGLPPPRGKLEQELPIPLTDEPAFRVEVFERRGVVYGVGDRTVRDPRELRVPADGVVEVAADADVAFKYVVAAVDFCPARAYRFTLR